MRHALLALATAWASGTDHAPVFFGNDNCRGTRQAGPTFWPVAVAPLPGMLNIDEHGFAIGCKGNAGDLALLRPNKETANLLADGVGA